MPNYHEHNRIKTVAAVWILFLAAGCSREESPESEPVVPVQVAAVQRSSIQRIVRAQGILHPYDQTGVMPKISAPVQTFYVNRGDHVRRGQLLAVLENRDLAAAAVENKGLYEQAEATYRSATAASLPEEIAKAQLEVQSSKEALAAAQKLFESRKELLRKEPWRAGWWMRRASPTFRRAASMTLR